MADTRTQLSTAPDFRPHRIDIAAVDSLPVTNKALGVNAQDYGDIAANLTCSAGGGAATFEVLFWSDQAARFVSEASPVTQVVATGTTTAIRFTANGRRFFIAVTALTAGRTASAEVAAFWVDPRFD